MNSAFYSMWKGQILALIIQQADPRIKGIKNFLPASFPSHFNSFSWIAYRIFDWQKESITLNQWFWKCSLQTLGVPEILSSSPWNQNYFYDNTKTLLVFSLCWHFALTVHKQQWVNCWWSKAVALNCTNSHYILHLYTLTLKHTHKKSSCT